MKAPNAPSTICTDIGTKLRLKFENGATVDCAAFLCRAVNIAS
jgi:hypothetical protein